MSAHFVLRVRLQHILLPVWRRVRGPAGGASFGDFHRVVQAACGWEEGHLYAFFVPGSRRPIEASAVDSEHFD